MADDWQSDPTDYLGNIVGSPVTISSGFRTPQQNALVGGVANSAHLSGQAYDFVPNGISTKDAAAKIAQSGIPFDQVIDEGDHVHISFAPANRRQVIGQKVADNSMTADDMDALVSGSLPPESSREKVKPQGTAKMAVTVSPPPVTADDMDNLVSQSAPAAPQPAAAPATPAHPAAYTGSTLADVIRSVPGGLVKGGAAIAGLPGDLNMLLDAAANRITGNNISTRQLPTSAQISNSVAAPFGGFYQPQTVPGQYAQTAAEFAPGALAPGNALLRAGRVAVPAATSETAGQLTAGTPLEPFARVAGALVGSGGLGAARDIIVNPRPAIPTTADIRTAATNAYTQAEQAGVVFPERAIHDLGQNIQHDVAQAGIDPTLHPHATAALSRLVNSTGDLTFNQLEILRRVANGAVSSAARSGNADEARIGHIILDHIDDFVENPGAGNVLSGNAQQASDAIRTARRLWAQQARSDTIDELFERARNRAEVVGGSGLENALRVEFRALAQNANRLRRFSQQEQDAIRQVARGGLLGNAARTIGKLAPTNLIAILGELGAVAHDPKALALPVVGTLGRMAATAATRRNALLASQTVRAGGQLPQRQVLSPEMLSTIFARKQDQNEQPGNQLIPSFAQ